MFSRMKLISFCLICLVCIAATTRAQVSVQSTANPSDDPIWIRPAVKIVNDDSAPLNLSGYTLAYYFYDAAITLTSLSASTWYYSLGQTNDVRVTFEAVDPAVVSDEKKANFAAKIQFLRGTLSPGNAAELKIGINSVTGGQWRAFDQTDDWSFAPSTGYLENENIVVKDRDGEVIFGEVPADDSTARPYGVAVYWLGVHSAAEMNEISLNEGDAYRNSDDGIAYVYYQETWRVLDDNSVSGGTMPDSNSHLSMSGSNITEVGTLQSNNLSVTNTVTADRFVGDGSGITNVQLAAASVLFAHLNPSTLDALVTYIGDRIGVRPSVISVLANASSRSFGIHRSGSTEGETVVSYVITKVTGASISGAAILADGAVMVEIPAFAGDRITVSDNPVLYQLDPLNTSASLPVMKVSIEKRNPSDPNDFVFLMNRDFPVNEEMDVDFRMTFADGSTYDISLPFAAGSVSEPWSIGLGYGDKLEVLPSAAYDIDPSAAEIVFPKTTVGIAKRNPSDPNDFVFLMNRDFPVNEEMDVDFRMTFADGSTYDISLPFAAGSVSEPWSIGLGFGDKLEVLPSLSYEIDAGSRELQF